MPLSSQNYAVILRFKIRFKIRHLGDFCFAKSQELELVRVFQWYHSQKHSASNVSSVYSISTATRLQVVRVNSDSVFEMWEVWPPFLISSLSLVWMTSNVIHLTCYWSNEPKSEYSLQLVSSGKGPVAIVISLRTPRVCQITLAFWVRG